MDANPERGEVAVTLIAENGRAQRHVLRPTFEALCAIEKRLERGIVPIARQFGAAEVGVIELATLIYFGILATEPEVKPRFEQIGEAVVRTGVASLAGDLEAFLRVALSGGVERDPAVEDAPGKPPAEG